MRWRSTRANYFDFGPMGWPRPSPIVLEDRTTGTRYLLSHDSSGDTVVLTTPVPHQAEDVRATEPLIGTPAGVRRLFVEDGALAAEFAPERLQGRVDPPVFTLNYEDRRTTYHIHGKGALTPTAPLCLEKYSDLGKVTIILDLGCNLVFVEAVGILDTAGVAILDTAGTSITDTVG